MRIRPFFLFPEQRRSNLRLFKSAKLLLKSFRKRQHGFFAERAPHHLNTDRQSVLVMARRNHDSGQTRAVAHKTGQFAA